MKEITVEAVAGTSIRGFAAQLIARFEQCKHYNCVVIGEFNGITLKCENSNTTIEGIIQIFDMAQAFRHEQYRNSPEGKRAILKQESDRFKFQNKADELMEALNPASLNFNNIADVLKWFNDIHESIDHSGVKIDGQLIVKTFIENGFQSDVNTGENYNAEDADNVARYIVGQCLSCIKSVGTFHAVLCDFIDDWNKKFPQD